MNSRVLILASVLTSALTVSSTALSKVETWKSGMFPDPVVCADGETNEYFTLGAVGMTVDQSELPFPSDDAVRIQAPDNRWGAIRLDVCIDADAKIKLHRIIQNLPGAGAWTVFRYNDIQPDKIEINEGLTNAAFGDVSGLRMEFKNTTSPKESFRLLGTVRPDGKSFVTLSQYDGRKKDALKAKHIAIFAGELLQGDPYPPKFKNSKRQLDVDGITIKTDLNYTGSVGMYLSYRFQSLEIVDKNIGKTFTATGDESPNIKEHSSHHGLMDSFEFTFPEATYKIEIRKLTVTYPGQEPRVIPLTNCDHAHECGVDISGR